MKEIETGYNLKRVGGLKNKRTFLKMNKDNRWLTLQYEPLSVDPAFRFATVPQAGAISSFIGTTRNTFEGE